MQHFSRFDRLSLFAYLALIGITAAGLWQIDRILLRWLALGLLASFGVLHSRLPAQEGAAAGDRKSQRLANLIIAVQTGLAAALIETTGAGFPFVFLFFILSVTVMLYNPLRPGLLWLGGFTLLTGWFFFEQEGLGGGLRALAIYAGGYLFFGVVTNALTQARTAQRQNALLLGELQAKNRQLADYASKVETLAVVEERNRLAREMHDTIGHRLTAAAVQLEGAQRLAASEPERTAALVGAGRQQVREALADLRLSVGRLREPVESELPLPQALHRLAASFQEATGLAIHLELPAEPCTMTPAQRLALYRTAQEGLTNIQRHAAAHQAWLRLECSPDRITLQVMDDGVGLGPAAADSGSENDSESILSGTEPPVLRLRSASLRMPGGGVQSKDAFGDGFGLAGLRERAARLDGVIVLADRPGGGAILAIELPAGPAAFPVQED